MADKTYDINISGGAGTTGGGGQKPANTASIDRLIKSLEALVRTKDKDFVKDLKPLFENLIKQLSKPTAGGPAKISQAEAKSMANELSNELSKQMLRSLTKTFSGAKKPVGTSGGSDSNILNAALRNADKQAQALMGGMASMLSRKGISIDPKDMKSLEGAITDAIRKNITTKAGGELRELSKAVSSMKSVALEISKAAKSVGSLRRSGGGIDLTEIQNITDSLGKISKEFKNFQGATTIASEALKRIPDDVKNIKEALSDVKRSVTRQVTGVRERAKEDPKEFARIVAKTIGDTLEKSPAFKQSEAGKQWKELEKTAKGIEDVVNKLGDVKKEISDVVKAGELSGSELKKLTTLLNKNITKQSKGAIPGGYVEKEPPKNIYKQGKKIVSTLEEVTVEIDTSKAKKEITSLTTFAGKKGEEAGDAFVKGIMKSVRAEPLAEIIEDNAKRMKKSFEDTFKVIERSSTAYFERQAPIKQGVKEAKAALKTGDVQGAMQKVVKTVQIADMPNVKGPLEKLKEEVVSWTDKMRSAQFDPGSVKKWADAYENLNTKTKEIVTEAQELKKETIKTKDKISDTGKTVDSIKKELDQVKAAAGVFSKMDFSTKASGLTQEKKAKFLSTQPQRYDVGEAILPGVEYKFSKTKQASYGKKVREELQEDVNSLSSSLDKLQKEIIADLEKSFSENKTGWEVVNKKFEQVGNQWKLRIANIQNISDTIGENIAAGTSPQDILKMYKQKQVTKTVALTPLPLEKARRIGEWLKDSTLEGVDELRESMSDAVVDILKNIKSSNTFAAGEEVSNQLAETINNRLSNELTSIFEKTYAKTKVESDIVKNKLVRTVTLPAAQQSPITGGPIFKTKHGSERAAPKFATYKTGFEELYDVMLQKRAFAPKEEYPVARAIQAVGFRPEKTGRLKDAKKLATDLFTRLSASGQDEYVMEQYKEAAIKVGAKRQKAGVGTIADFEKKTSEAVEEFRKAKQDITTFVEYMENFGISAYDVVKSMENIKFENVYDIYRKVIKGTKEGAQPLSKLGKSPNWDSAIREYEQALRSVEQLLPVIEPGKIKRGKHYEDTLTTMFHTSSLWKVPTKTGRKPKYITGGQGGMDPEAQKERIQEVNMNLRDYLQEIDELYKTGQEITPRMLKRKEKLKLPGGVRTISSLGPPEAQAASYEEYRPEVPLPAEQKFLKSLDATAIKLYTEKLLEQAPFGEFGRMGRNIANVSGAMGSGVPMGAGEVEGIKGLTTQFPSLRTTRERDIISAGRYGQTGYGFNVLAELKHTAGTFEDQIIISGKLADALTQAVSNLVKPSAKGRLGAPLGARGDVTTMSEKALRDVTNKEIKDSARKFMDILGVPEKYTKDADKALIKDVSTLLTTVRGEDVEVQKAKLLEVFMSNFARKFVTRYGTKGVSVKAAGPEGLGTAEIPKSMGELAKEILEFIEADKNLMNKAARFATPAIKAEGFTNLKKDLAASGNKFMLSLFSDVTNEMAKGLGVEEEIKKQAMVYEKFTKIMKETFGVENLPKDVVGIKKLKEIYSEKMGPEGLATKKPIEIRISSTGVAKRGLQAEFLESIMGNVIGAGSEGKTTVQPTIPSGIMKELLGTAEQKGVLSKYSEALGYTGAAKPQPEIKKELFEQYIAEGKKPEEARILAEKGAALEAMSSYYAKIKDEYGKAAKSIVGPKFVQIVEEPHQTEGWSPQDVEELSKGGKLNLPAYSAYATIFGEKSPMMEQIKGPGGQTFESKKQFEYIKALEAFNTSKEGKELSKKLMEASKPVELAELKPFDERTGTFFSEQDVKRSLKDTILDVEKYTTALTVQIPKGRGPKPGELEREPFYIPGPLARQTYPEELIAGEMGMDLITRRIQDVVNKALAVEQAAGGAGGMTAGKDIGELDSIIREGVVKLLKESQNPNTDPKRRKAIAKQLFEGLQDVPVEEAYRVEGSGYAEGITEREYINEFYKRFKERYAETGKSEDDLYKLVINRLSDILIKPKSGTLIGTPSRIEKVVGTGDIEQVQKFAESMGLGKADEEELNKRLASLTKAKIAYMRDLTQAALGKKGAIAGTAFLRKTPSIMAKAVSAVTDKTVELKDFSEQLKIIGNTFEEFSSDIPGLKTLDSMAGVIDDIRKEHAENVAKYKEIGLPVLGQHELGVPKHLAKKIPVTFEKKYEGTKKQGLFPLQKPETVEGDLFQMLDYRKMLEQGLKKTPADYQEEIKKHMEKDLQPFIESIRYPFTGVSSVQPYKAKILPQIKTEEGRDVSKYALAVPGVPEMNLAGKGGFSEQIEKLKGMSDAAFKLREKLYEQADKMGGIVPEDKIKRLSDLIDTLNKAISDVIPKYTAVQQKLDYDGDMIQVHSGVLSDARQDIEKHYKSITDYTKGMGTSAQAWRDIWTAEETTPATSKKYPLADIMTTFEKKWPGEKGYEFLKRPEITEKLDYIKPQEQLNLLAMAKVPGKGEEATLQAVGDILKSIVEEVITQPDPRSQILKSIDDNIAAGKKSPDELLSGIESLDKNFKAELSKLVTAGIKDKLYEQKYSDAIVAQLYKLHTGQQTEGIYRLHRIAERRVGFGPGMAEPTAKGYRTSPEFAKRWPSELKVFGQVAPESEIHTFINELERFATQKGMDVKHAGARPVAGEIAGSLSRGTKGVETLIDELSNATTDKESEYAQLAKFSEASKKAIESRLGKMSTQEIISDVGKISAARGLPMPDIKNRKQAMEEAVKLIGFEGFLRELAMQIEEDAVNAYVTYLKSLAPRARAKEMKSRKGMDLREFAEEKVQYQMGPKGMGINTGQILEQTQPLYSFRAYGATQKSLADKYSRTSLQAVEIPKELAGTGMEEEYKNAQEVSRSIQRALQEVSQIKGGGTYTDMVVSTLENIYKDQTRLESILTKLQTEGYPIGEAPGIESVGKRLFTAGMPEIPSITKELIDPLEEGLDSAGWVLDNMKKKVDEYSQLAGVSPLGAEVKRAIEFGDPAKEFAEKAKEEYKDVEKESLRDEKIDKYVKTLVQKASAVAQMDKVIASLKTKTKERDFITQLLPSESDLSSMVKSQIESDIIKPTRDLITEQARKLPSGKAGETPYMFGMEEQPPKPGMGAGAGGGGAALERLLTGGGGGDSVPVFITGVAEGIGLTFTPAGAMQGRIDVAKAGKPETDLDKLAQELGRLHDKSTGVIKTMKATYQDVFRASALSGGGSFEYKKGVFEGPEFEKEQIKAIKSKMRGARDTSPRLEASAFYGTALHKEIQDVEKKKLEKETGGKKTYDVERLVEYQDALGGYISGHADMIEQQFDDAGEAVDKKIIDIKTVSDGMVKRFKKAEVTKFKDIGELKDKDLLTNYDIKKLNEVASQINLYIKAVAEANGVAEDSLKGEAWFYDRDDIKNMAKIEFDFDPKRLDRDMKSINSAREDIMKEYGSQGFAEAQHRLDLTRAEQKRKMGKPTLSTEEWNSFSKLASEYWGKMKGRTDWSYDYREKDMKFPKMARSYSERAKRERFDKYDIPKAPETGGAILDVFANLQEWHNSAKEYAKDLSGIGFDTSDFEKTAPQIKQMLGEVKKSGPKGMEFHDLLKDLQDAGYITGPELAKAWKYYRIAVGDFFLAEAERASQMEAEFKSAGKLGAAGAEYGKMRSALNNMKKFVEKGLGKATDIYTSKRRYIRPDLAQELGMYLSPRQLMERSQGPLETPKLKGIFEKRLVGDVTKGEKLTAPIEKIRGVVKDLSGADDEMVALLTDAQKFKIMGDDIKEVWNLDDVAEGVIKLRAALQSFLKFKFQEGEDLVERKNLEDTLKLLKNIEAAYTPFRGKRERPTDWGEMGLNKVPGTLAHREQEAMHMQNLQKVREYYKKTEEGGGPRVGERYIYPAKVMGEAGNVIKNVAYDFIKYGDAVNFAGEKVGIFKEKQRDIMEFMQGSNRTFGSAIMRAVRWGAASKIVYGGWQKLWDSVGLLADIETGMAQIKMVMSPLQTNFDMLGKAAIGFAKQYGTSMGDVLKSMKVFAQQGLSQEEVIDRTKTATLASNVTTLSAKEATEALTAAMKVFRQEGDSSMRFMDAWSEVEAKHAITAGDMANALKKAAAAGKNAGFTFDELNGVIAAIGSVTRQTGQEVGTSMRFIFRRLASEEGPKNLAKIGIPVLTDTGELRRGFDVLHDLSMSWQDLTSAQKMNIAQAIGGTRQYNSLLVLMDNWQEALSAIKDSTNSKGSAERRNLELMKTYAKQLEQVKAAATEVYMSFGKITFPAFKAGLKTTKYLLEAFTEIPAVFKGALAAAGAFFVYMAKGASVIDYLMDRWRGAKSVFGGIFGDIRSEWSMGMAELFGLGATEGLKVVGKKKVKLTPTDIFDVDEKGVATRRVLEKIMPQGRTIKDFHSVMGKTVFLIKQTGKLYNEFIGDSIKTTGDFTKDLGRPFDYVSKKILGLGNILKKNFVSGAVFSALKGGPAGIMAAIPTILSGVGIVATEAAGQTTKYVAKAADWAGSKFGDAGKKFVENFAADNTSFVKSITPLAASIAAVIPTVKMLAEHYSKVTGSAQDYEKSMYGVRRENESQLKSIRDLSSGYGRLESTLADVSKASDPKTKKRRQELGTFVSPLLTMSDTIKKARDLSNDLASTNTTLVSGYDKFGNAILGITGDLDSYLKTLEKIKIKEMAKVELNIAAKFVTDLTETEGPEKWKYALKNLLKEAPGFGEVLAKGIKISPAKAMDVVTERLNNLLALKKKFPMSTAFDKDINKYQTNLKEVRSGFATTYGDFKKTLSNIETKGLTKDDIVKLFGTEELRKGFELMIDIEPRFNLKETKGKVKYEDILGAEVMKKAFPSFSTTYDATAALTKARLESAGAVAREGKAMSGDMAFFMDKAADKYNIAGNQAVVSLKKTTDGVFDWFVTYFNDKTLRIEERPFTEDMRNMVDSIFPKSKIEEELNDRIEALNEFVAGAAAGLRGISAKDFKKDFSLGERFFSEIPTTTILQGAKGFVPGTGGKPGTFGKSPFQEDWKKTTEEFFFKPMREYRLKAEQLEKLKLEGLQGGEVTLAKGLYEELTNLQNIMKNNQVVLQYRAVFTDLTKTISEGTRVLAENLAAEKSRLQLRKGFTGYMKGVSEGLDTIDLGVQNFADLNVKQRALVSNQGYGRGATKFRELEMRRGAGEEQVYGIDKALVALERIGATAKGFGAAMTTEEMKKYVDIIASTDDTGAQAIAIETSKVVDNTASTVDRLDKILENMPDADNLEKQLKTADEMSPNKLIDALEKTARIRDKSIESGNKEMTVSANKTLDVLVNSLTEQVGLKKAMGMVDNNFTFFSKRFKPDEFAQRAFGGLDFKQFSQSMEDSLPKQQSFFKRLFGAEDFTSFSKDVKPLIKLQEESNSDQWISSKNIAKTGAAMAALSSLNKYDSSRRIDQLEEQKKQYGEGSKERQAIEDAIQKTQKGSLTEGVVGKNAWETAQGLSAVTTATTLFAKEIGLTEQQIKALGASAGGLYSFLKVAEMPKEKASEKFQTGGLITGPGGPKDDKINIDASNGEYVIAESKAKKLGYDKLDYMNKFGKLPAFAEGGEVTDSKEFLYGDNWKKKLKSSALLALTAPIGGGTWWPLIKGRKDLSKGQIFKEMVLGGAFGPARPWLPFQDGGVVEPQTGEAGDGVTKRIFDFYKEIYGKMFDTLLEWGGVFGKEASASELIKGFKNKFGGKDDKPIRVSNGEYVIAEPKAKKLGYDKLDYINNFGELPGFAEGGVVGTAPTTSTTTNGPAGNFTVNLSEQSIGKLKQVLIPYLAATAAGYVAQRTDDETRLKTLNKQAEAQAEMFAKIVEKYPKAGQKVIDNMRAADRDVDKLITSSDKKDFKEVSKVLDTDAEREKIVNDLTNIRKDIISQHEKMTSEMSDIANKLAKAEVSEKFKMELEAMEKAINDIDIANRVSELVEKGLFDINWRNPIEDVFKFPKSAELLTGKYRPQPVDYGIRSISEMTPEQYLVHSGKRVSYKPSLKQYITEPISGKQRDESRVLTLLKDWFSERTHGVSRVASAEDIFKKLDKSQQVRDLKQGKLVEAISRKDELAGRAGFFGTNLSAGEKEELSKLDDVIDNLSGSLEELTENIAKYKDSLKDSIEESREALKQRQSLMDAFKGLQAFNINRLYSDTSALNKNLKGFAGEAQLPKRLEEMGPQERLYAEATGPGLDAFKKSMSSYSYAVNEAFPAQRARLIELSAEQANALEQGDTDKWEKLGNEIIKSSKLLDTMTNSLSVFGKLARPVIDLSQAMSTLKDSIREVANAQTIETLPAMEKFRKRMEGMYGGGGVNPLELVLPEQQRRFRRSGQFDIGTFAKRKEVEKAELEYRMQYENPTGQAAIDLTNAMMDLDEKYKRLGQAAERERQTGMLREEQAPYKAYMGQLEKIRTTPGITPEAAAAIKELQNRIAEALEKSADVVSAKAMEREVYGAGNLTLGERKDALAKIAEAGPDQFRGIPITLAKELSTKSGEIREQFLSSLEKAPTLDMDKMQIAVTNPIGEKLDEQTAVLRLIAQRQGISSAEIAKTFKSMNAPSEDSNEGQSIFAAISRARAASDKFFGLDEKAELRAAGGRIFGEGGPRQDKVPALVSPGEYVIRAASAQRLGYGTLEHMNQKGTIPGYADGGAVAQLRAIGMSEEDIKRELGGIEEPLFGPGDIIGMAGGATKLLYGLGKGVIKQIAKKPKTYEELLKTVVPEKTGLKGLIEKFREGRAWKKAAKKWSKETPMTSEQQAMSELSDASRTMLEQAKIPSANDILKVVESTKAPTNRAYELGKLMHENPAVRKSWKAAKNDFDAKTKAFGPLKDLKGEAMQEYMVHTFRGSFFREADELAKALANPAEKNSATAIAKEFLEGNRDIADFTFAKGGLVGYQPGGLVDEKEKSKFDDIINRASEKYGVESSLIRKIIKQESAFNPLAVSKAGAEGLMQLMPGTAKELGVENSFDPAQNIMAGTRYFKQHLDKYNDTGLALAAYNAGPKAVEKYGGIPPYEETQNYVKNILKGEEIIPKWKPTTKAVIEESDISDVKETKPVRYFTDYGLAPGKLYSLKDMEKSEKEYTDIRNKMKEVSKALLGTRSEKGFKTEKGFEKEKDFKWWSDSLYHAYKMSDEDKGKGEWEATPGKLGEMVGKPEYAEPRVFSSTKFGELVGGKKAVEEQRAQFAIKQQAIQERIKAQASDELRPIGRQIDPQNIAKSYMREGQSMGDFLPDIDYRSPRPIDVRHDEQTGLTYLKLPSGQEIAFQATKEVTSAMFKNKSISALLPSEVTAAWKESFKNVAEKYKDAAAGKSKIYQARISEAEKDKMKVKQKLLDDKALTLDMYTTLGPDAQQVYNAHRKFKKVNDNLDQYLMQQLIKDPKYSSYLREDKKGVFGFESIVGQKLHTEVPEAPEENPAYLELQRRKKELLQGRAITNETFAAQRRPQLYKKYRELMLEQFKGAYLEQEDGALKKVEYTNENFNKFLINQRDRYLSGDTVKEDQFNSMRKELYRQPGLSTLLTNTERILKNIKQGGGIFTEKDKFDANQAASMGRMGEVALIYKQIFDREQQFKFGTKDWKKWMSKFPAIYSSKKFQDLIREYLSKRNKAILEDSDVQEVIDKYTGAKTELAKGTKDEEGKPKDTKAWYSRFWDWSKGALKTAYDASQDVKFGDGGKIPVMHKGGIKKTTGLAYLEGGEVVFPKKFAEGGKVDSELATMLNKSPATNSLNAKIEIDTSKLEELIERGIEVNIDDSIKVGVDPGDVKVGVDPDAKVAVDIGNLSSELAEAVRSATSNITVKIDKAGAVGAAENDALAKIAEATDNVNNKLITVKRELEDKIEMVVNGSVDENMIRIITNEIETKLQTTLNSNVKTDVDDLRREITQQKQITDVHIDELKHLINGMKTKIG